MKSFIEGYDKNYFVKKAFRAEVFCLEAIKFTVQQDILKKEFKYIKPKTKKIGAMDTPENDKLKFKHNKATYTIWIDCKIQENKKIEPILKQEIQDGQNLIVKELLKFENTQDEKEFEIQNWKESEYFYNTTKSFLNKYIKDLTGMEVELEIDKEEV